MNKNVLYVVIGVVLLIGASVAYVVMTPSSTDKVVEMSTLADDQASDVSSPQADDTTETTPAAPGVYRDYSADAIAKTKGTKLLFFHAPWCSQCRSIEASINENGIPSDVTVFKVDYDSNQKLRQRYGVTLQTTFVKIDDNGDKIESYVAYEEPVFGSVERELLR